MAAEAHLAARPQFSKSRVNVSPGLPPWRGVGVEAGMEADDRFEGRRPWLFGLSGRW